MSNCNQYIHHFSKYSIWSSALSMVFNQPLQFLKSLFRWELANMKKTHLTCKKIAVVHKATNQEEWNFHVQFYIKVCLFVCVLVLPNFKVIYTKRRKKHVPVCQSVLQSKHLISHGTGRHSAHTAASFCLFSVSWRVQWWTTVTSHCRLSNRDMLTTIVVGSVRSR